MHECRYINRNLEDIYIHILEKTILTLKNLLFLPMIKFNCMFDPKY